MPENPQGQTVPEPAQADAPDQELPQQNVRAIAGDPTNPRWLRSLANEVLRRRAAQEAP